MFSVFPLRPVEHFSVLTKNKDTKTFSASYELQGDNEKSVGVGGKRNEPNLFFSLPLKEDEPMAAAVFDDCVK